MEKILNTQIVKQIEEVLAGMKEPVQILYFGSLENCEYCADTQQLLEEVTATNSKIELKVYDIQENRDVADKFNVKNVHGIVIAAKDGSEITDYGIQY